MTQEEFYRRYQQCLISYDVDGLEQLLNEAESSEHKPKLVPRPGVGYPFPAYPENEDGLSLRHAAMGIISIQHVYEKCNENPTKIFEFLVSLYLGLAGDPFQHQRGHQIFEAVYTQYMQLGEQGKS